MGEPYPVVDEERERKPETEDERFERRYPLAVAPEPRTEVDLKKVTREKLIRDVKHLQGVVRDCTQGYNRLRRELRHTTRTRDQAQGDARRLGAQAKETDERLSAAIVLQALERVNDHRALDGVRRRNRALYDDLARTGKGPMNVGAGQAKGPRGGLLTRDL